MPTSFIRLSLNHRVPIVPVAVVAACVAVPGCDTITTWGFTDRLTWIDFFLGLPGEMPLPFDEDYVPKPAYFGITDALAGP